MNRLRLLRMLAKDAMADGLTERDFCARVKPPACRVYTEDDPNCLSAEQLDRLAAAIPDYWYPMFAVLAFTGLRFGEASALKWDDLDYEAGLIRIRRSNWKGRIVTTKTRQSVRGVPMAPALGDVLKAHRDNLVAADHPGLRGDWVFPTRRGELHAGTPLRKVLRQSLPAAGIEIDLTPHGLRRTFNDLARRVAKGLVVRAMMGHATEAMTEHYSMVDATEKQAAQEAVMEMARAKVRAKKFATRGRKRGRSDSEEDGD